jgi:hypothetical protein
VVLEAEDNLTGVAIVLFHEHGALQNQLLQNEKRSVNPIDIMGLKTQQCFVIDPGKPGLSDLGITRDDNLETLAYGLCGSLSDQNFGVSKRDPNELEDLRHETVEECWGSLRKLPNDEHRREPSTFLAL